MKDSMKNEPSHGSRFCGVSSAKVIQVIVTETLGGRGIEEDPARVIKQYWSLEGKLLAKFDPFLEDPSSEE